MIARKPSDGIANTPSPQYKAFSCRLDELTSEERKRLARRRLLKSAAVAPFVVASAATNKAVAATKVVLTLSLPVSLDNRQCFNYPRHLLLRPRTLELNPYVREAVDILAVLDVYGDTAYASRPLIRAPAGRTTLEGIVFPKWSKEHTATRSLSRGETAIRLMDNSLNLRHLEYRGVQMAATLARSCPAFELEVEDPRDAIGLLEEITVA